MIMGIPNVGKSTLMNTLVKRRVAAVGDEPAVTKSQQRINLSPRLTLVDTPGLMWPKIEHDADGYHAGGEPRHRPQCGDRRGSGDLPGGILLERYPARLTARYGFELAGLDAPGVLEAVARKRGCILKGRGGELDLEKAAHDSAAPTTAAARWAASAWKRRTRAGRCWAMPKFQRIASLRPENRACKRTPECPTPRQLSPPRWPGWRPP